MAEMTDDPKPAPQKPEWPQMAADAAPAPAPATPDARTRPKREFIPTVLTPKMQQAIRLVAHGDTRVDAAKKVGLRGDYVERVMRAPIGRAEFARVKEILERAAVDKMAAAETGTAAPGISEAAAEVELAVLEAIKKMRSIMNSSKSDVAVVNAAKQILELAQAAKRMAAHQAPAEEFVPLSNEDEKFLAAAIGDLRFMNAGVFTPAPGAGPGTNDNDEDEDSEDDESVDQPAPVATTLPAAWNEETSREVVEGGLSAGPQPSKE